MKQELVIGNRLKTSLVLTNYHVEEAGLKLSLTANDRHCFLESAYLEDIPWVDSEEYMKSWSESGTRQRFARIAYHPSIQIESRKELAEPISCKKYLAEGSRTACKIPQAS